MFPRRSSLAAAAVAGLLGVTGTAVAAAPQAAAQPAVESFAPAASPVDFYNLVNATRAGVGAAPLGYDARLEAHAQAQAQAMASVGTIFHSDIGGLLGPFSTVGENVGAGPSVEAINAALVTSPGHYANLSSGGFTLMGVGVAVGPGGQLYTAHVFGA